MSDGRGRHRDDGDARVGRDASVDELVDRAVAAINRGDRVAATALAGQVLAADEGNADAEDLLTVPGSGGEIRRLTILFADLVDSTALSGRVEPETYRMLVGRYRDQVLGIVNRLEGHIGSTKGDGLLAVFGYPTAHENDVRRAVLAGLEITRDVATLSAQAFRRFGVDINVRVGVHRGLVYLDTAQDDVYGLAANLAARVSGLAAPGAVVVSDAVAPLITDGFELAVRPSLPVKGVEGLIAYHQVLGERDQPAKASRGPLVGRESELGRLARNWARAQDGTLSTPGVVFRGEPGIGKSRLAAAAVELAEGRGAAVLELAGSPFHTDAGLHPVRTLLEHHCGISRSTDPAERLRLLDEEVAIRGLDRVTTVPLLATVLGIGPEAGYEPVAAEGRKLYELIAGAVQSYVLACVGGGAGLVLAEDVHWFDPSTMEVLGSLLEAAQGRLLVAITGRPGGWLPAGWRVKVVDLKPLTGEQTDTLIVALNPALSGEDRAAVAGRCDGVPFYIEQVVAGLTETGVPEALYEPLFARLRASANVVPVVEAAGVIGRHVDRSLLGAVVDLDDDEVDDVLDELEDALVLEPWGSDGWRFRHELLREVAYELAPPSVRRGLHAKVADSLLDVVGGKPDWRLVARHYEQAERFDDAATAYQQASESARGRGALDEARTHLTNALAGLNHATPGPDRDRREIALRVRRGFLAATAESYSHDAALDDFEKCLELAGTDVRDDELAITLVALSSYYALRADLVRIAQLLESLRAGLSDERPWLQTEVEASFGWLLWMRGEFDTAVAQLELVTVGQTVAEQYQIDAVRFLPDEPIGAALIHLAWARLVCGDLAGAEDEMERTAHWVTQLGFPQGPFMQAYRCFVESWMCVEAGQLDRAAVVAGDLAEQAARHGLDMWRLVGAVQHAVVSVLAAQGADDPDPADLMAHFTTMTALLDTLRTAEITMYRTFFDAVVGRLLTAAGQLDAARAHLDTALALAQDTGMHFYDAELLRLRAQTRTDPGARRADIAAALDLAHRQGATLFELRAALDDFELRGEPARAALRDVANRMQVDSAFPELARAQAMT